MDAVFVDQSAGPEGVLFQRFILRLGLSVFQLCVKDGELSTDSKPVYVLPSSSTQEAELIWGDSYDGTLTGQQQHVAVEVGTHHICHAAL